jgi:hypothetical protein
VRWLLRPADLPRVPPPRAIFPMQHAPDWLHRGQSRQRARGAGGAASEAAFLQLPLGGTAPESVFPGRFGGATVLGGRLAQLRAKQLPKLLAKLCQRHPYITSVMPVRCYGQLKDYAHNWGIHKYNIHANDKVFIITEVSCN